MGREELVRRFGAGDLIACSTLQRGLCYFDTSFGFWAYRRVWGMDVTLGGPICARKDRAALVERFLSTARRPVLCYVRDELLCDLDGAGLHAAGIGIDHHADLGALLARPAAPVRGAVKKARRAGLELCPLDLASMGAPLRRRLDEITERYLAHAQCTVEMSFLNRPMSYEADGLRRVFLLAKHDREHDGVFGYAVLNPVFDDGRLTSYLLDILRFEPTRLWGVWLATVHRLAELLVAESKGLALGFCPLHRVHRPKGASRALSAQMEWMARLLSSAQYLRQLRELKGLIPGTEEPRSVATFSRSALVNLFAFMEASGVGFAYLFGPDLLSVLAKGLRRTFSREAP
jgi:lysylphosphatidylglycerol synthetase-like protein (DUF2156 family)